MIRSVLGIEYELTRKNVKNINLRITRSAQVRVSANSRVDIKTIDAFVISKAQWIKRAIDSINDSNEKSDQAPNSTQCMEIASACAAKFAQQLGLKFLPEIRIKPMKSRWGVCFPRKNRIHLSSYLFNYDYEVIEYVVLHELAHFIHPNHQSGFHAKMKSVMPDYKSRSRLLRNG